MSVFSLVAAALITLAVLFAVSVVVVRYHDAIGNGMERYLAWVERVFGAGK